MKSGTSSIPCGDKERNKIAVESKRIPTARALFICAVTGSVHVRPFVEMELCESPSRYVFTSCCDGRLSE